MNQRSATSPVSRLTDRSKRILALAAHEALRLRYRMVEPEHVVLGLIADGSVADQTGQLGTIDIADARRRVEAVIGRGDGSEQRDGVPASPQTKALIGLAADEADRLATNGIGPKHFLLALALRPGSAEAVLDSLGLSQETLRSWADGESREQK